MIAKILETNLVQNGDKILCGVSGGADSMAMLIALMEIPLDIEIFVCHLNHNLRGEFSNRDEKFVQEFCQKNSIPFISKSVKINDSENDGRIARYDFFSYAKQHFSANKIATAHNTQDVLETFLINMSRGTGLDGLCSIPFQRDDIIRPILCVKRSEIESYLSQKGQIFMQDDTNYENKYTRNKIRNLITPILNEINPNIDIISLVKRLSCDRDYLNKIAREYIDKQDINILKNLDIAIKSRVIALKIKQHTNSQINSQIINNIINIIDGNNPSAKLNLPYGLTARRIYDKFIISKENINNTDFEKPENKISKIFNDFNIDFEKVDKSSLSIRHRQIGDIININGCTKTLKKLMIEKKVPKFKRDAIDVVFDKNGIIAIEKIGADLSRLK